MEVTMEAAYSGDVDDIERVHQKGGGPQLHRHRRSFRGQRETRRRHTAQ